MGSYQLFKTVRYLQGIKQTATACEPILIANDLSLEENNLIKFIHKAIECLKANAVT